MNNLLTQKENHQDPVSRHDRSPGRITAIKRWFHYALLREEYDDKFSNEECISVDDKDDLILVPSFYDNATPSMPLWGAPTSSVSERSATDRSRHRRHKLRNLRGHLKLRLHNMKYKTDKDENHSLKDINEEDKLDGGDDECYKRFRTAPKDLEALFEYAMRKCSNENHNIAEMNQLCCEDRTVREMEPFQNLSYEDVNRLRQTFEIVQPICFSQAGSYESSSDTQSPRGKRHSDEELDSGTITKRVCFDKEGSSSSPMESMDMFSATISESDQNSIERTPSFYLTKQISSDELNKEQSHTNHSLVVENLKSLVDYTNDGPQDTSGSCHVHGSLSTNGSSNASSACPKVYTIPTFRRRSTSLNVSGIVKSFRNGTLDEKQLAQLANTGSIGKRKLTFQNKRFYDEILPGSEYLHNEEIDEEDVDKNAVGTCGKGPVDKSEGAVKFDKHSYLLVYKDSKKCSFLKSDEFLSISMPRGKPELGKYSSTSAQLLRVRSILKSRANAKEEEEIKRATHCDKVDISSFMNFFEHFENKRHVEEYKLGKVREQQLNHYYSEKIFPELLQDIKIATATNSEFNKSKKATELNIGRKLGDIKCNVVHYICNSCESKVQDHSASAMTQSVT